MQPWPSQYASRPLMSWLMIICCWKTSSCTIAATCCSLRRYISSILLFTTIFSTCSRLVATNANVHKRIHTNSTTMNDEHILIRTNFTQVLFASTRKLTSGDVRLCVRGLLKQYENINTHSIKTTRCHFIIYVTLLLKHQLYQERDICYIWFHMWGSCLLLSEVA